MLRRGRKEPGKKKKKKRAAKQLAAFLSFRWWHPKKAGDGKSHFYISEIKNSVKEGVPPTNAILLAEEMLDAE